MERVWQGLFEPAWGPYRNAQVPVPKKNGKYHFIISAMSAKQHTVGDAGMPPSVEEFFQAFAGLPISSVINIHSAYDQTMLRNDIQDYMAFQTTQGMYWHTRLVQGATNSVSACVRVSWKILITQLGTIAKIFVDNAGVKCPKSGYGDEEVEGLTGVRRCVIEHHQNLHNMFADVERAGATMSGGKSDWCWNRVKIVGCVCGEPGRWPQASEVDRVWDWPWFKIGTERRSCLGLGTYYQIRIPEYAIVAGTLFQILQKNVKFQSEIEEQKAIVIWKETLCTAPGLKMIEVRDGGRQIDVGVDTTFQRWGAILQQKDKNMDQHPRRYECRLSNKAEKRYTAGKCEWHGVMNAVKKWWNDVYGVRFLVETDANTLLHHLSLPTDDLPGAQVALYMAWIWVFDLTWNKFQGHSMEVLMISHSGRMGKGSLNNMRRMIKRN